MTTDKYILQGTKAIPCNDLIEWATWMSKNSRRVAFDTFEGVEVSTVFLGLDHNHFKEGDPLLFETMVFTDIEGGGDCYRYFIWEEAIAGHAAAVAKIKEKLIAAKQSATKMLDSTISAAESRIANSSESNSDTP